MKYISLLLFIGIANLNVYSNSSIEAVSETCLLEYRELITNYDVNVDVLPLPYSETQYSCMRQITQKGQYSLWKVQSNEVTSYPHDFIVGNRYNYFVFKGNNFHMTVNDFNKYHIYSFFIE